MKFRTNLRCSWVSGELAEQAHKIRWEKGLATLKLVTQILWVHDCNTSNAVCQPGLQRSSNTMFC